jgi:hypothetical protein
LSAEKRKGWAIRWREWEIAPDGMKKRVLRYETLGKMSRREAANILREKQPATSVSKAPTRSRVTFRTIATEWTRRYSRCTSIRRRSIGGSC